MSLPPDTPPGTPSGTGPAAPVLPHCPDALRDEDPVQLGHSSGRPGFEAFWQGIVCSDEQVLWSGRPDPELAAARAPKGGRIRPWLWYGAALAGGALLLGGSGAGLRIAGMALGCIALILGLRARPVDPGRIAGTRYLISNQAVYIARLGPGMAPAVRSLRLGPGMALSGGETSVSIALDRPLPRDEHIEHLRQGERLVLSDIHDAGTVLDLLRSIQKGMK